MADPTMPAVAPTVDAPGSPIVTPPTDFYTIDRLQIAVQLYPGDLIQIEQYDPAKPGYLSKQVTFEAFRRLTHPDVTYVTTDHAAITMDCGFAGDAAAGPFTIALMPVAQMGCREMPILNVGATGSFVVAGQAGDLIYGPAGPLQSLSFAPGETARLRAVSVPAPSRSGWYLVGV